MAGEIDLQMAAYSAANEIAEYRVKLICKWAPLKRRSRVRRSPEIDSLHWNQPALAFHSTRACIIVGYAGLNCGLGDYKAVDVSACPANYRAWESPAACAQGGDEGRLSRSRSLRRRWFQVPEGRQATMTPRSWSDGLIRHHRGTWWMQEGTQDAMETARFKGLLWTFRSIYIDTSGCLICS